MMIEEVEVEKKGWKRNSVGRSWLNLSYPKNSLVGP